MIARALRKIQTELLLALENPDGLDPDIVKINATRIGAQAEALDEGLGG